MIGIIDYGMGNLRSVQKAFEKHSAPARFLTRPDELGQVDAAVLPGVGAFRDAIGQLRRLGFDQALPDYLETGRPLLGICLGLQLLFDRSYEDGTYEGLGLIAGEVVRFASEPELKIPHMGWNSISIEQDHPLLEGLQSGDHVYFVHSYYVRPVEESVVATRTAHGTQQFVSMIARDNLYATQFHPEKSQRVGLHLLRNFANLVSRNSR
jgi:imidazole glycerol-phosphate synthase subunit HisH